MPEFHKSKVLTDATLHYCPGCTHGIVHRLVAEVIEEINIADKTIGIAPVGCGVFAYNYFNLDMAEAAHGRAPVMATGIKRVRPDRIVFTYQGDGDLASIGACETIHAAARNENITIIFLNNGIYGMTGGQMAPTSCDCHEKRPGYPIRVAEMLAALDGPQYIARCSTHDAKNVLNTKKAIKKAFQNQVEGRGFSLVEILTTCPTNWGLSPLNALKYVEEKVVPYYPLGVYKEVEHA